MTHFKKKKPLFVQNNPLTNDLKSFCKTYFKLWTFSTTKKFCLVSITGKDKNFMMAVQEMFFFFTDFPEAVKLKAVEPEPVKARVQRSNPGKGWPANGAFSHTQGIHLTHTVSDFFRVSNLCLLSQKVQVGVSFLVNQTKIGILKKSEN